MKLPLSSVFSVHYSPCFTCDETVPTFRYHAVRQTYRWQCCTGVELYSCRQIGRQENSLFLLNEKKESVVSEVLEYKSWVCLICGWIYNEEDGLPEDGIAAGTRFADIPESWRCPLCDVGKEDFVAVEF
ncbi:rubredoxin-like protein [Caballeronia sordidicola]|uniref:Rubredoxin n=1 Tax=Caballeronia sordidicola TaxID=196367 RepID=A0A158F0T0_CABSO|nr:rubredoxin-like protein [Caballeronia sordidicola]